MDLSEVVNRLFKIESELRELATELQMNRIDKGTYKIKYEKLVDKLRELLNVLKSDKYLLMYNFSYISGIDNIVKSLEHVETAFTQFTYEKLVDKCKGFNNKTSCQLINVSDLRKEIENVKNLIGRKCGNLILYEDKLYPPAIIDGLANCVHVIAEELNKYTGEKIGKCIISKEASNLAKLLCLKWDQLTEKFKEIYSAGDYHALSGHVINDKVSLRVGSAQQHATHINVKEGKIEYYDFDIPVVKFVEKMIERIGGSCKYIREHGKLECNLNRPLNENDVDYFAWIFANVTSLDINLNNMTSKVIEVIKDRVREELAKITEVTNNPHEILWKIEALITSVLFKS